MYCISISHKTAPLGIRELFSFTQEEKERFIKKILGNSNITECVLLSTCNRSEVYFCGNPSTISLMEQFIAEFKNISLEKTKEYYRIYIEDKAVEHLFKVTGGMDSMVLGEDEILGQVKEAYQTAHQMGSTGFELNTVFLGAITCAKKIKTDTKLSKTPVSIGTLTANEVLQFKKEMKNVLIIGITGKMGTIIRKNLSKRCDINMIGTTRNHNIYLEMKNDDPNVEMINYKARYQYMDQADIIISATTSPHYTITYDRIKQHMNMDKERLFIDLSVPHDIDKDIVRLDRTKLIDIDYFEELSKQNNRIKLQEMDYANLMIEEQMDEVLKDLMFHAFQHEIPRCKNVMESLSLEQILYKIKKNAQSTEFKTVLSALKQIDM